MKNKKNALLNIIIAISGIVLVAVLGSVFVSIGMDWFESLVKPSQWIPNFVIPLVWTVIYVAFGIILFLILKRENISKWLVALLVLNGIFNVLWCLLFFTCQLLFVGNICIVLNAVLAFLLVLEIAMKKRVFGLVLSIYPIWVCVATTLNLALWILN